MEKLVLILLTVAAGMCNGFQPPVNAALGRYVGVIESSTISFTVGAVSLLAVAIIVGKGSFLRVAEAPPNLWVGGLLGAFFVTVVLFVVPKIGGAVTIASVITGQMTAALIIDQIGLLGIPKNPIDLSRIAGLVCLAIGIKLLTK